MIDPLGKSRTTMRLYGALVTFVGILTGRASFHHHGISLDAVIGALLVSAAVFWLSGLSDRRAPM